MKLSELHADLKMQEREEFAWKKLKAEGLDADGERAAKLLRNLSGIFLSFSVRGEPWPPIRTWSGAGPPWSGLQPWTRLPGRLGRLSANCGESHGRGARTRWHSAADGPGAAWPGKEAGATELPMVTWQSP